MSSRAPDASVVVATRNRARRLEALLHSIAAQAGVELEVVVVDNGSSDATPELLARDWPGLRLRAISVNAGGGPAAARNAGWRAARSDLIVFADDDVEADPGWLAAFVEAHRRRPDAVLQGLTEADPGEVARAGPFNRSRVVTGPSAWYPTCNIAYPRALLERLGGFSERYSQPWCEDTDLGWRARRTGHEAMFVEAARVRHAVHQLGLVGYLRASVRLRDTVSAVADHPELRRELHRGLFLLPEHERLLGVVAGLALARRTRGASLALALPYVLGRRRMHRRWAGALAALPGYLLIDAAEVASLAIGSARSRTLVL
jgi:glycosyltransferase involved in cell wall biosynthesis